MLKPWKLLAYTQKEEVKLEILFQGNKHGLRKKVKKTNVKT
jgi:hypothetical protein